MVVGKGVGGAGGKEMAQVAEAASEPLPRLASPLGAP